MGAIGRTFDPDVRSLCHSTIKQNGRELECFFSAGCGDNVVRCFLPTDDNFPKDYARGDARFNAIYLTDPAIPVYGFGPSLTDFRREKFFVSHVLLGFSAFTQGASRHNLDEFLGSDEETYVNASIRNGCMPGTAA